MRTEAKTLLVFSAFVFACAQPRDKQQPVPVPAAQTSVSSLEEAYAFRRAGDLVKYEEALRTLTSSADATTARRATARLGLLAFEQKRWNDAVSFLTQAAAANPRLAPHLTLRIAEAEEARNDLPRAIEAYVAVITAAPDSAAATTARLRLPSRMAQAFSLRPSNNGPHPVTPSVDEASFKNALAAVDAIPIDELTEPEFVTLADRLDAAGRHHTAANLRLRLLRDYTQGRFTEKVYSALLAQTPSLIDALPLDQKTDLAAKLARADRYDQALDLLERIGRAHPEAATASTYRAVRIRSLFHSRHYEELLAGTDPRELRDPGLLLLRARAAWRAGKGEEFLAGLTELEKAFPNAAEAAEAKVLRAKYYTTDEPRYELATQNLVAAIDAGAIGRDGENLWTLGWVYTLAGRYDDALGTFDRYLKAYPDADYTSNALFWSAKIHHRRGATQEGDARFRELIAKYPYSYFSYRARELWSHSGGFLAPLGMTGGQRTGGEAAAALPNGSRAFPDVARLPDDPRLGAVEELLALDLAREATGEMKRIAAAYPEDPAIAFRLADVYARGTEPFRAMSILQRRFREFVRHGGEGIPRRFWEILFPLQHWPVIAAEAAKRSLDPFLLASIIRQESGFEPHVVSNAGAVGLMQIMPEEAPRIAEHGGLPPVTREQLFDPPTNIAVGAAEYAQKLELMRGNHILAIAAYNAGPDPVGRWIARTPVDDLDLFVESIPYAETRLYVKSVTRNRFEYRRIYESSRQAPEQPAR